MILWRAHVEFPPKLLGELTEQIKQSEFYCPELNIFTSYGKSLGYRVGNDLENFYGPLMERVTKRAGLFHRSSYRWSCWAQLYGEETSHHALHDHFSGNEILSWVHFLKTPESNKFIFLDSESTGSYVGEDENMFILFPSWCLHQVLPLSKPGKDRVIVAGNVELLSITDGSDSSFSVERTHEGVFWKKV